jgi:tricorn protease-like protein
MKKLIPILITIIGFCFGQTIEVIKTEQILAKEDQVFAYPKFSPQGDKILLSSPKYKGLWVYETENNDIKQLNNKTGAGYQARFSPDGSKILFRYNTYQNHRKFSTLALQNIDSKKTSELVKTKEASPLLIILKKNPYCSICKMKNRYTTFQPKR